MRRHNLPTVVKLLEVHGAGSHYRLLGTWERGRPPGEGEREVRLQQLDLDAFRLEESHRVSIRVPVNVRVVQLLPPVELLRID